MQTIDVAVGKSEDRAEWAMVAETGELLGMTEALEIYEEGDLVRVLSETWSVGSLEEWKASIERRAKEANDRQNQRY